MDRKKLRHSIRSILLPVAVPGMGLLLAFILKKGLGLNLSKTVLSLIALAVTSGIALFVFPRLLGIPFGRVTIKEFFRNLGFRSWRKLPLFIILGVLSAGLTLTGMLVGSLLTGKYTFSSATITLGQAMFSLTPGIWEEILLRGVLMIVLLRLTKSVRKAFWLQILIFAVAHIKGVDLLSLVDAFSVGIIAIAFTYMAWKTKSLIPGMIFHYLHDTFLFAVQLPGGNYYGVHDNALFYTGLWLAVALIVWLSKIVVERFALVSDYDLFTIPQAEAV